jgi:hypothetical protein
MGWPEPDVDGWGCFLCGTGRTLPRNTDAEGFASFIMEEKDPNAPLGKQQRFFRQDSVSTLCDASTDCGKCWKTVPLLLLELVSQSQGSGLAEQGGS